MDEGGPGHAKQRDNHKHNCLPGLAHQISSLLAFLVGALVGSGKLVSFVGQEGRLVR